MTDRRTKDELSKRPKCRSLHWNKSTWHEYKPVDPNYRFMGRYVERCVKCGQERTVETV